MSDLALGVVEKFNGKSSKIKIKFDVVLLTAGIIFS
jgi:hypothetical protein